MYIQHQTRAIRMAAAIGSIAALLLGLPSGLRAAPFDQIIPFTQPDGTKVSIHGFGDEFHAVFESADGFTVTYDPVRRGYCYADLADDGSLVSTGTLIGPKRSTAQAPHLRMTPDAVQRRVEARRKQWDPEGKRAQRWRDLKALRLAEGGAGSSGGTLRAPPNFTTTGIKVGLCLLIDFDDDPATIPQAEIVNFCNGDAYTGYGNNGSVKKYFLDNSGGLLTYSNVVTVYIRIPNTLHPKSWYNDATQDCGTQGNLLVRDALNILKAMTNYTSEILPAFSSLTVDGNNEIVACNVFYAGGNGGVWSQGLWPHSWSLYNVGAQELSVGGKKIFNYQITNIGGSLTLGTFCHENGHMLIGYPDVYDYGYDSIGGAGIFCLMNSGGHGGNPVQICAYLRAAAGWCTPINIDASTFMTATLTAAPDPAFNTIYRYTKPNVTTEYFLIENRQPTGRDSGLPSSGIAIWHVDELGDHNNQSLVTNSAHLNYEVTLVQADNQWHFQSNANSGDTNDLYRANNGAAGYTNAFSDATTPRANWWDGSASGLRLRNFSTSGSSMTFDIVGTGGTSAPDIVSQPISQLVSVGATATLTVAASGLSPKFFQWRKDAVDLADGGRISGVWTNALIISGVATQDAGGYSVVVSNELGTVTSQVATLSVSTLPSIFQHPTNVTVDSGQTASFHVGAIGSPPLAYQWRRNGTPLPGATNSDYVIAAAATNDAGSFDVVVENGGGAVTSATATLTVLRLIALGEAVDQTGLVWTTSGSTLWKGRDTDSHDGQDAAVSGAGLGDSQYSLIQCVITGPMKVAFWWKVSSEANYDYLVARIDGVMQASISGETGWLTNQFSVPYGTHTASWAYVKDANVKAGQDLGWLDAVTLQPGLDIPLSEALDATNLTWQNDPVTPWIPDDAVTYDGVDSARSGITANNQTSTLRTAVAGPGELTFRWKASSEANYDFLIFKPDGVEQARMSGNTTWSSRTYAVASGVHTMIWCYVKDTYDIGYNDCGYLDVVSYAPALPTNANIGTSVTVGEGFSFAFTTEVGRIYNLEYATALSSNTLWTPLPDVIGNGSVQQLGETNPPIDQRYYRVRVRIGTW